MEGWAGTWLIVEGTRARNVNRSTRITVATLAMVFLLWALPVAMLGQGIVIPRRCPGPWPLPPQASCIELGMPLPVQSISFSTSIRNQVAQTRIVQVFMNPHPWAAEGTFYFPIPETASIEEFALWIDGKRVVGELVEREKARQTYDEIVRKLRDPGLLEYVGKNLFQARMFPIAPRSEQKIEIRYTQVLKAEQGVVRYSYPLGVGHNTLRQPIASLAGKVDIQSNVPLRNIYSPTHALEIVRKGETQATVSFEQSQVMPTQDFALYYALSEKEFGLSLLTYRENGKEGYFLALLSPKVEEKANAAVPKDTVFVLDTSGSMSEEGKLSKAREALNFGIRSLHAGDFFNVVHFASEEHRFEEKLVPASKPEIERAVKYVSTLEANGGTDIDAALQAALTMFTADGRPHFVVFLTDGLPTVGQQNIARILEDARRDNSTQARIFTVGVGYDVNTHLLDPLAENSRGDAEYIAPKEDLEVKVSDIFTKVNSPVLTNLRMDWGGVKMDEVYPKVTPDLFKGTQLVMVGRYSNDKTVDVTLRGEVNAGHREFNLGTREFPPENRANEFIPRLWAIRKVGYLLDQMRLNGETQEVKEEVIRLATKYGLATPYTSFLVTAGDRRAMPMRIGGHPSSAVLGGIMRSTPSVADTLSLDMTAQSGPAAVQTSSTIEQLKGAELAAGPSLSRVRYVRQKTFVLKDGVWVDTAYDMQKQLPHVQIVFASEVYFHDAAQNSEMAEYFSLGPKVLWVMNGKVYEVVEK